MSLPTDDKARKALPIWTFLMGYFPDALLAVVGVAVKGNEQHNPGQPLHWAREKSTDQLNTAFRHMWDHGRGTTKDTDGQYHLAKAIWRLSAELQLLIEAERTPQFLKQRIEQALTPPAVAPKRCKCPGNTMLSWSADGLFCTQCRLPYP